MAANYVIVISILEGKNFPVRHEKYLLVEAKFDGEIMSTDPVPHIMYPHFNTELAWEVDKKGLQLHRLQRSPIKLQWYAADTELLRKEAIGYIVLDIKLAQEKLQRPKWFPLLNSKYPKTKPEVLLSLYLERVSEDIAPHPGGDIPYNKRNSICEEKNGVKKTANVKTQKPTPVKSHDVSQPNSVLKPVLLSYAGCYQIGPPELCNDKYVFSVTLSFAANLNKLTPPAMLKSSKGFYFYYSLFDNDVMTEEFSSLSNPDFLAERASVKISSSPQLLSKYFEENPYLDIVLYSGDISLGSGQIPLGPLSCVNKHNIKDDPLCIEGSVQIIPTEKTSYSGNDLFPFIGVTVVLQEDKPEQNPDSKETNTPLHENSISEEKCPPSLQSEINDKQSENCVSKIPGSKNGTEGNCGIQNHKRVTSQGGTPNNGLSENEATSCNHSSDNSPPETRSLQNMNGRPFTRPMKIDTSAINFSFTLDLCNFQATRLSHPINLFIRYSYPFFGTSSSVITHPDIEVNPKCEVSIPHGYCEFNFATTFALLKSTFWETPLILEVLNRKKGGQEQLIGNARINLFQVLNAPSMNHTVNMKQGRRQMSSCKVAVISSEGYEIGDIYVVLTLINLGRSSALCDRHSSQPSSCCHQNTDFPGRNFVQNFDIPQNGLTQDELLQAAMQLEFWQERQMEIFRTQLKEKEIQHLSALTSEWKQRDMERELLLQKQLQECQKLEDKLKGTLKDAELKEKQLTSQEMELSRKLRNIDEQQEKQQKELKNHIESIKMEYNELLSLERLNVRDLEQKNNSLMRQIKELERDLQEQRSIIDSLKSQLNKDPDIQLRTEVNILNMEKAELQQKLEAALASKQKYKIQWGQAVRQISLLQQKLHLMERLELAKKEEVMQQKSGSDEKRLQNKEDKQEASKDKVDSSKSAASPEKAVERPAHLGTESTSAVSAAVVSINSVTSTNALNKAISNSILHLNSSAKPLTNCTSESVCNKSNVNTPTSVQLSICSNSIKPNAKYYPIPDGVKHLPDMNGNTSTKEYNLHLQHLLAKKDDLLKTGLYTEQDQLIKDLDIHIEKAKLSPKLSK